MFLQIQKQTKIILLLVSSFVFFENSLQAQEQKSFQSLEEVLNFAKSKHYVFTKATIQTQLADLTQKTAWGNVFNPRIPATIQTLDNFSQQVIFMPGEIFGQQAGTFREITTGQQYTSVFNVQPQFDIFNLGSIFQVKAAKINQELTAVQNSINEKAVYDQINSIYFNILSFQGQIEIVKQNLIIADNILRITQDRFSEDISRKQDLNEAEVNQLKLKDNLEQLELNLKIQEASLALFFENEVTPELKESVWNYENTAGKMETSNSLQVQNANLQVQAMEQDYRQLKAQHVPTLSCVSSFSWQNVSNDFFFSASSRWIDYAYVGLKLSMDLPTNVTKLSATKNKQFQREMLAVTAEHAVLEAVTKNKQLILEYDKSVSQLQNLTKIALLKEDTYLKNFNQYRENILSLDKLLISHTDFFIARLNLVSALATIGFNKSRIDINNKF